LLRSAFDSVVMRSSRCLRSWNSCAMNRWETLFGTVV
jgi:hypothetical protein